MNPNEHTTRALTDDERASLIIALRAQHIDTLATLHAIERHLFTLENPNVKTRTCKHCGEEQKTDDSVCWICNRPFLPPPPSRSKAPLVLLAVFAGLCGFVFCFAVAVFIVNAGNPSNNPSKPVDERKPAKTTEDPKLPSNAEKPTEKPAKVFPVPGEDKRPTIEVYGLVSSVEAKPIPRIGTAVIVTLGDSQTAERRICTFASGADGLDLLQAGIHRATVRGRFTGQANVNPLHLYQCELVKIEKPAAKGLETVWERKEGR